MKIIIKNQLFQVQKTLLKLLYIMLIIKKIIMLNYHQVCHKRKKS